MTHLALLQNPTTGEGRFTILLLLSFLFITFFLFRLLLGKVTTNQDEQHSQ